VANVPNQSLSTTELVNFFFPQVSEAIIEEEDEQVNVERNLDEIDDQM
jgi:hypothetical protein